MLWWFNDKTWWLKGIQGWLKGLSYMFGGTVSNGTCFSLFYGLSLRFSQGHGCLSVQVRWNVSIQCLDVMSHNVWRSAMLQIWCSLCSLASANVLYVCLFVSTKMISLQSIWSITCFYSISIQWLVVWNMSFIFPSIGNFIIPTDFHIFQDGF